MLLMRVGIQVQARTTYQRSSRSA